MLSPSFFWRFLGLSSSRRSCVAPARPSNFLARPCIDLFGTRLSVAAAFGFLDVPFFGSLRFTLFARDTLNFRGNNGGNVLSLNNSAASTAFSS
jgi:hypothetical protein